MWAIKSAIKKITHTVINFNKQSQGDYDQAGTAEGYVEKECCD